jgi:ferredoxin
MPIVKFVKEKKEIEVPPGANLRKEALRAGVGLYSGIHKYLNCHGFSLCASCKVKITSGIENVSPMGTAETVRMKTPTLGSIAYIGNDENLRLACQVQVNGDITVETHPEPNLYGENFFS